MSSTIDARDATQAPADESPGQKGSARTRNVLVQSLGITAFLVILIIIFASMSSAFVSPDNAVSILTGIAFIGLVALGQTLVIIAGGFDLSVAGVAPLSAVIFAKLVNAGTSIIVSILGAVVAGVAIGLVNGLIVTKGKINPLITTLGMLSIAGGLAFTIADGQSIPIENLSAGFLADTDIGLVPNQVWLTGFAFVVMALVLRYTTYGRALYAIGGNREASWLAGMRVDAITISVYALSGMFAGLGGVMLASQLLAGDGNLGATAALLSVAAVVLGGGSLRGGSGGALGTLAGVLVLGVLANGLTLLHVSTFYQQIVTGLVLLVSVGFSNLRSQVSGTSH
ncbi:ABC transporter permease [Gordonia sp. C13]|uniref:ABC transporter permease n=1 Tax=Gordonia sp. C13 TaxID=2935078 RepID=UPI00200B324A|nr:ABC transporter permease [Gordonia sp. C13]MCK8615508.1 ABC transporter permease [Gordonia sp. C13]